MLAGNPDSGTYFLDSSGATQKTYEGVWANALALDRDGHSFWAGNAGTIHKYDINTGAISTTITLPSPDENAVVALAVVGEPRAATNTRSAPTLSHLAMAILFLIVGLIGLLRIE